MNKVRLNKNKLITFFGIFTPIIFLVIQKYAILLCIFYFLSNSSSKLQNLKKNLAISLKKFIFFIPLIVIVSLASKFILPEFEEQEKVLELKDNFFLNFIKNTLTIIILAPIVEEIIFRGFFYKSLKQIFPSAITSVIVSSVFSLVHFNILSFPLLMLLSLFLNWIYECTGQITCAIIIHSLFNCLMLFLIYIDNYV